MCVAYHSAFSKPAGTPGPMASTAHPHWEKWVTGEVERDWAATRDLGWCSYGVWKRYSCNLKGAYDRGLCKHNCGGIQICGTLSQTIGLRSQSTGSKRPKF